LATILYQPSAAATGSLLIWMNHNVYVMDIDTSIIERVAPAKIDDAITPSPGCYQKMTAPCWVVVNDKLYSVSQHQTSKPPIRLTQAGEQWPQSKASWSPDGLQVVYVVDNPTTEQFLLQLYNTQHGTYQTIATDVDPTLAVAWSADCEAGFIESCWLGYKTLVTQTGKLPYLVGHNLATSEHQQWEISNEPIDALRWSPTETLLYSRPKRYFYQANNHTKGYHIPNGAKLASMSPSAQYTVYYQSFTLSDCPADEECLYVGVWLTSTNVTTPTLLYNVDLKDNYAEGLNFIPIWAPHGKSFVFFQEGNLIHYDIENEKAVIWYQSLQGKLRSVPVFSPREEAVAFTDSEGQGLSDYRLVIINPRLKPIERIIKTEAGFKVLAWLPN